MGNTNTYFPAQYSGMSTTKQSRLVKTTTNKQTYKTQTQQDGIPNKHLHSPKKRNEMQFTSSLKTTARKPQWPGTMDKFPVKKLQCTFGDNHPTGMMSYAMKQTQNSMEPLDMSPRIQMNFQQIAKKESPDEMIFNDPSNLPVPLTFKKQIVKNINQSSLDNQVRFNEDESVSSSCSTLSPCISNSSSRSSKLDLNSVPVVSKNSLWHHFAAVATLFQNLYTHDKLTDVTVYIDKYKFSTHKAILMAHSKTLWQYFIQPERRLENTIHLDAIPYNVFQLILMYMYTEELGLCKENVEDFYNAAKQLNIKYLLEKCIQFSQNLNKEDTSNIQVVIKSKVTLSSGSSTTVEDSNLRHQARLGNFFHTLYKHDSLTNVIVQIDQYKYSAHKAVLMAYSDFFYKKLINTGMHEHVKMKLDSIPANTFQAILEYMYTGNADLKMENVANIHYVSKKLVMKKLTENCNKLFHNLTANNALIILETASKNDTGIYRRAFEVVKKQFPDIINSPRLAKQEFRVLIKLLTTANLVVDTEMDVFQAAFKWISHDYQNREENFDMVFGAVRFCDMAQRDIEICNEMMKDLGADILPFLADVSWSSGERKSGKRPKMLSPIRAYRNETPVSEDGIQTAIQIGKVNTPAQLSPSPTHRNKSSVRQIKTPEEVQVSPSPTHRNQYSMMEDKFQPVIQSQQVKTPSQLSSLQTNRNQRSVGQVKTPAELSSLRTNTNQSAVLEDETRTEVRQEEDKVILVVGGIDVKGSSKEIGKSIFAYRIKDSTWQPVGELPEDRNLHAVTVMMDCLYVIGGSRISLDNVPLATRTVFEWDLTTKEWSQCSEINYSRVHHSAVTLNQKMYALAGQDERGRVLKNVEMYDPESDFWEEVAPLSFGRIGMSVSTHRDNIMVVGGNSQICSNAGSNHILETVEMYTPDTDTWITLSKLPYPRCHCALAEVNDDLYLFGGLTCVAADVENNKPAEVFSVATVDKYNAETDEWQKFTSLKYAQHGIRATVVGSQVFILGGIIRESGAVNTVECLDMKTGETSCFNLGSQAQMGMGLATCDAHLVLLEDTTST